VTLLRRLDHVAVLVRDTEEALRFYHERLGLPLHSSEEIEKPHVRLTYLDAGNA
jgi:methylmalonyl-CoA/ethylmalonyl-CoA epimerase